MKNDTTPDQPAVRATWAEHYQAVQGHERQCEPLTPTAILQGATRARGDWRIRPDKVLALQRQNRPIQRNQASSLCQEALPTLYPAFAEAVAKQVITRLGADQSDLHALYHALCWAKEGTSMEEAAGIKRRTHDSRQPRRTTATSLSGFLSHQARPLARHAMLLTSLALPTDPMLQARRLFLPASRFSQHVEYQRGEGEGIGLHYAAFTGSLQVMYAQVGGGPERGYNHLHRWLTANRGVVNQALADAGFEEPSVGWDRLMPVPGRTHTLYWSLDQPLRCREEARPGEAMMRLAANNIVELIRQTFIQRRLPNLEQACHAIPDALLKAVKHD